MSLLDVMFISATRKTPTFSKNTEYESVPSYASTTINCYVGSSTDFEQMIAGKWTIKAQNKFYADTKCTHGDIIVYNGENYRLIGKMKDAGGFTHHYKGYVEHCTNID
jgi:outer membrane lipoprotein-sorting protein